MFFLYVLIDQKNLDTPEKLNKIRPQLQFHCTLRHKVTENINLHSIKYLVIFLLSSEILWILNLNLD